LHSQIGTSSYFRVLIPRIINFYLFVKKKKKLAIIYNSSKGKKRKGGGKMQENGKVYCIVAVQDVREPLENTPLSST
jgi:hypothetical protein